jgi:hypothetical protein
MLLYLHVDREFLMSLSDGENVSLELHYISLTLSVHFHNPDLECLEVEFLTDYVYLRFVQ